MGLEKRDLEVVQRNSNSTYNVKLFDKYPIRSIFRGWVGESNDNNDDDNDDNVEMGKK